MTPPSPTTAPPPSSPPTAAPPPSPPTAPPPPFPPTAPSPSSQPTAPPHPSAPTAPPPPSPPTAHCCSFLPGLVIVPLLPSGQTGGIPQGINLLPGMSCSGSWRSGARERVLG